MKLLGAVDRVGGFGGFESAAKASSGIILAFVVFASLVLQTVGFADEDAASDTAESGTREKSAPVKTLDLPKQLPDGRPIRSIGISDAQKFELIPPGYYPVQGKKLVDALENWEESVTQSPNSPLRSSEYVVAVDGGLLECKEGFVELENGAGRGGAHWVGQASFAVLGPEFGLDGIQTVTPDGAPDARILSRRDGSLLAVTNDTASATVKIPLRWRQRGDPGPRGYKFEIRFPKSPQTRFVFSTQSSVVLKSDKGVLRERTTEVDSGDAGSRRQYELDAGGLDSVVLTTQIRGLEVTSEAVVVRRNSVEYNLDSAGLAFTQRIELGLPVGIELPRLRVVGVPLTSVKVNASEASFVPVKNQFSSVFDFQVVPPAGAIGSSENRVSLTLTGQTTWSDVCELPLAGLMNGADVSIPIVDACTRDEARVTLDSTAKIVDWMLPPGWLRRSTIEADGISVATAMGVSLKDEFDRICQSIGDQQPLQAWSSLQLSKPTEYRIRDLWLRADVKEAWVDCEARFKLQLAQPGLSPLRFFVQPGWKIDRMTFLDSGRVLESPAFEQVGSIITVWPEYEDMKSVYGNADSSSDEFDNQYNGIDMTDDRFDRAGDVKATEPSNLLRLSIRGKRAMPSNASPVVIPKIWMVRACDQQGKPMLSDDFTAGISSPENMNWAGDTAMTPHRIDVDQLRGENQQFFGNPNATMLYFKPRHRQIDPLSLENPNVDLEVNLQLIVTKSGNQIQEELRLEIVSADQNVNELSVQTGPSAGRPRFRWSLSDKSEDVGTHLSSSEVGFRDETKDGLYRINLSGLDRSNKTLTAYRTYSAKDLSIQLPSVPNAISANSQLFVGRGLKLAESSSSLQQIPRLNLQARVVPFDSLDGAHYRYDSVQQPVVELVLDQQDHRVNVVGQFQVRMVASSRGSDRIELWMNRASINTPLVIRCLPELKIASVLRDGRPLEPDWIASKPIVLLPLEGRQQGRPEDIRIVLERSKLGLHVMRRCRIPSFELNAIVLNEQYQVVAAVDSFAPRTLLSTKESDGAAWSLNVVANESTLLIRRDVVLALGWFVAILIFSGTWAATNRWPYFTLGVLLLIGTSVLLWWPWRIAIVGWLIVPVVAAAMLVTSRRWTTGYPTGPTPASNRSDETNIQSPPNAGDPNSKTGPELSTEFSWQSMMRSLLLVAVGCSLLINPARTCAQPPSLQNSFDSNQASQPTASGDGVRGKTQVPSPRALNGSDTFTGPGGLNPGGLGSGGLLESSQVEPETSADSVDRTIAKPVNVIVPMNADRTLAGDFVYVPESFHRQLLGVPAPVKIEQPGFLAADYRMTIQKMDPASNQGIQAEVVATYDLEFLGQVEATQSVTAANRMLRFELPIKFEFIEQMEWLEADGISTLRFADGTVSNLDGGTVVSIPSVKRAKIRCTLRLAGTSTGSWMQFAVDVPPVSNSKVQVESEMDLPALRIGGNVSRLVAETDLRRWSEFLGPSDQINVGFRVDRSRRSNGFSVPLQRRYWVSSGSTATTIDCEIDPPDAVAAGESFQFVIRDSAMPILLSPDWRLMETVVYAPQRRRVRVMSLRDAPGPVQLLWTLRRSPIETQSSSQRLESSAIGTQRIGGVDPKSADGRADADLFEIDIPDIVSSNLTKSPPAWIALHCSASQAFDPMPTASKQASMEPLSVDQFLAAWSGYRGRIDRAFVALDELPSPRLREVRPASDQIQDRHQLRVSPRRLQLSYEADVQPGNEDRTAYLLSIPQSLDLVDLYLDGKRQDPVMVGEGARRFAMIRRSAKPSGSFQVSAFAIGSLPDTGQFEPPVLVLGASGQDETVTATERDSSYTVFRTKDTFVQIVEPFAAVASRSRARLTADSLIDGYFPLATWTANSKDTAVAGPAPESSNDSAGMDAFWQGSWGGVFRVQQRTEGFDCDQLVSLTRTERDWMFSSHVRFLDQKVPDYVDIEIPTRWCESIQVFPSTVWTRQSSTSGQTQIVRVSCEQANALNQTLTVTGKLSQKDDGRVSVPNVRVLGSGARNLYFSVPRRLINERVQWRRNGVERSEVPANFAAAESFSDSLNPAAEDPTQSGANMTFRAVRDNWMIDLAPLPELSLQPIAISQDTQVYSSADQLTVVTQWDVYPGSQESIRIRVPPDATCKGAWAAGVSVPVVSSVPVSRLQDSDSGSMQVQHVEIPLSISQLPQSVRVLFCVPVTAKGRKDYVPTLVNAPVTRSWLAIYEPDGKLRESKPERWQEESDRRYVSLAQSAVESIELAVDILAERSSDELVPWLTPWLHRYKQCRIAAGLSSEANTESADVSLDDDGKRDENFDQSVHSLQWAALESRIRVYADRFIPDWDSRSEAMVPRDENDELDAGSRQDNQEAFGYDRLVGADAVFSPDGSLGYRLGHVMRLGSPSKTPLVRSVSGGDGSLQNTLRNALSLALVTGFLACVYPWKRRLLPWIQHPALWLAVLGVVGLFVAPPYVAVSLIFVAISMPWFPTKAKRSLVALK